MTESSQAGTKINCTLVADFRHVPDAEFRSHIGVDGSLYYMISYHLVITLNTASMKFSAEINGKRLGTIEAMYEADDAERLSPAASTVKTTEMELDDDSTILGLRSLYDGTDVATLPWRGYGDSAMDIVAVHGLGGHPIRSFTDLTNRCCWLRDLLPVDSPLSRVFSYGYDDAYPVDSWNFYDVALDLFHQIQQVRAKESTATRPLLLIGVDLGGLIVKRLLVYIGMDSRFKKIHERVAGVLFFGTPQRGTSSTSWTSAIGKITRSLGKSAKNEALFKKMRGDSKEARELHRLFEEYLVSCRPTIRIHTFYEERPVKGLGILVERSSTVLDHPLEVVVSMNCNHFELCKFSDATDVNYRRVLVAIQKTYSELHPMHKERRYSTTEGKKYALIPETSPSAWSPHKACDHGSTAMGLWEMDGSMEHPRDYTDADVDLIAVHSLGGSPIRSWINSSANTMWLREMLQKDFPDSRVMSYGYKSEAAVKGNSLNISRLALDLVDNVRQSRLGASNFKVLTLSLYATWKLSKSYSGPSSSSVTALVDW
jgi:hypothetical protein